MLSMSIFNLYVFFWSKSVWTILFITPKTTYGKHIQYIYTFFVIKFYFCCCFYTPNTTQCFPLINYTVVVHLSHQTHHSLIMNRFIIHLSRYKVEDINVAKGNNIDARPRNVPPKSTNNKYPFTLCA